ncbi:stage II sporulation protein M [Aeromicrobium sp. CF3.5]|uniref:stage II sporulation protein M n=1 Tax=Aeromicrobium sp. CF3.5 TaxID=3373078 RepID=UPI003EE6B24F
MHLFTRHLHLVRANLRPFLLINALVYGVFLFGIGAALVSPSLQTMDLDPFAFDSDWTASLVAKVGGSVAAFGLTILVVNVLPTALMQIALPSLIVPFVGLGIFAYRAFNFGVTLAPTSDTLARIMIPHSLTLLIEFQAYILVMLGAYLLGRAWISPTTVGSASRSEAYRIGLRQLGGLSVLALPLFVLGAFYEAFEIIHLVPMVLK